MDGRLLARFIYNIMRHADMHRCTHYTSVTIERTSKLSACGILLVSAS